MRKRCDKCTLPQRDALTETVTNLGTGWKCLSCGWWNWLVREKTVCSTMVNCHRPAKKTGDPARPPFCNRCKRKHKKNLGKRRTSRAERRKIRSRS